MCEYGQHRFWRLHAPINQPQILGHPREFPHIPDTLITGRGSRQRL